MSLSDYTSEELELELEKRAYQQPDAILELTATNIELYVVYSQDRTTVSIGDGCNAVKLSPYELRLLSIMVSTARHNGKEKTRS